MEIYSNQKKEKMIESIQNCKLLFWFKLTLKLTLSKRIKWAKEGPKDPTLG